MSPRTRWFLGIAAVLLAMYTYFLFQGPPVLIGRKVSGVVVDARTSAPPEGVIVVYASPLQVRDGMYMKLDGYAYLTETSTDANGRFDIPEWFTWNVRRSGRLGMFGSPILIFMKEGYLTVGGTGREFQMDRPDYGSWSARHGTVAQSA